MSVMAIAASAMMFVSCGNSMSPEAAKAWQDVKDKSVNLLSPEDADKFESVEAYQAAVQEFNAAVQEMGKYPTEYSEAIADSFTNITTKFAETAKVVKDMTDAAAAVDAADAAEAAEGAVEEVVEE